MNASDISRLYVLLHKVGLSEIWKKKSFACPSENETSVLTDDF